MHNLYGGNAAKGIHPEYEVYDYKDLSKVIHLVLKDLIIFMYYSKAQT